MTRFLIVPLFVLSFAPALAAPPGRPPDTRTLSPYFFVQSDDPSTDRLPLKSTSAAVDIVGVIARVRVTQVYRNEGRHALEAIYVFPGSTRAAVHGMTMTIGERVIRARIEERQEARRQYAQALQSGRTASLLEQQRPNVFQMNVANILPGDDIKVELVYSELLVPERGVYEFVYPTVVGPRYSTTDAATAPQSEHWVQNPYLRQGEPPSATFDFRARIAAGMPLLHVASPSHRIKVNYPAPSRATVTLSGDEAEAAGIDAGASPQASHAGGATAIANRDVVLQYQLAGDRIEAGVLLYEGQDENVFLCMVEPPQRFAAAAVPPREYVFIMDVSGSMNGFPIETSKELLRNVLTKLRPQDYFNVLFFSGGTWVLSTTSLAANEGNKAWALQEIAQQHGGGGTELLPALRQAFDLPRASADVARAVVIATDGYVNVEREAFALIRERLGDASVFAFGIGSSVNRHLIEGMARVGEGMPFVVLNQAEAKATAARFLEYIQSPLLTRVAVATPGFDVYDLEPGRLPDMFAERPLVLVGKYRGPAAGEIVITGFTGQGRFERRVRVDRGRAAPGNDVLEVLWARERLSLLSDLAIAGGDDRDRKPEVIRLGLKYGLLTEFTSFVAVDQRVRRQDGRVETVRQPLPLPEGVSDLAVGSPAPTQARAIVAEAKAPAGVGGASRDAASVNSPASGQLSQPAEPSRAKSESLTQVDLVENRLTSSGQSAANSGQQAGMKAAVQDAVRRAIGSGACAAVAGSTSSVRLKIVFDARGEVQRVEGTGAAAGMAACVREALRTFRLAGGTTGYVVVLVKSR